MFIENLAGLRNMTTKLEGKALLRKLRRYRDKYSFLSVNCRICGCKFTCSGHCLKSENVSNYQEGEGCICFTCDNAKSFDPKWFKKCEKGDEVKMMLKRVLKRGRSSRQDTLFHTRKTVSLTSDKKYCLQMFNRDIEQKCSRCCYFCENPCPDPKCWSAEFIKDCVFRLSETEVFLKMIDSSYKTKAERRKKL